MVVSGQPVAGTAQGSRGWAIAAGILLIFAGLEVLASPYFAALLVALWVAWGLVFGGVAELLSAYGAAENRAWKVVRGLLFLAVGVYMLRNPGSGLVAVVLALAWLLLVQGVISIFGALQLRPLPGWGWWMFDGLVTLILALLVFSGWPTNSARIIAVLVGISLLVSGVNRLASAAR
jgi:uncharacterized membrane protein HdeD (DUF308 family)